MPSISPCWRCRPVEFVCRILGVSLGIAPDPVSSGQNVIASRKLDARHDKRPALSPPRMLCVAALVEHKINLRALAGASRFPCARAALDRHTTIRPRRQSCSRRAGAARRTKRSACALDGGLVHSSVRELMSINSRSPRTGTCLARKRVRAEACSSGAARPVRRGTSKSLASALAGALKSVLPRRAAATV